jgi:ATP-binding cassette subfamily F protein 3
MSLAQFSDVHFSYPGNPILEGASLLIRPGDRLALVGPNGAGKSTALRLLAGDFAPDSGDARVLGRASVAYLRQSQELTGEGTVLDELLLPFADLRAVHDEMEALAPRLGGGDEGVIHRYGELQERYQHEGGYALESRVKRLTHDVGFSDDDLARSISTLSGGERGRLELAKVLVREPDLLLLDEPTNHLDLAAIERLEAFLAEYSGAFLMVSHDRAFMRATCKEIVELADGKFVRYPFGYDRYVVEREAELERARAAYDRQKTQIEKTEDFIRRNIAGQKTKQAQSRRKMLDKLDRLDRPDDAWEHAGRIALNFNTGGDLGSKETIRASHLSVGYPGSPLLADITVNIYRQEKIGIVGANGAGKSTLLRTLIGELPPLAGKVEIGTGVNIGYFDQKLGGLDESLTLIDEIRSVRADLSPDAIRQYLSKFRFFGDDPFRTVKGLSGGERSRLAMAKIMLFPRNVLVLDEPTNHLDIPAREVLEDALSRYEGTILAISHDRYFLDRFCTRLLVIEGGTLESHLGNYSDWRQRQKQTRAAEEVAAPKTVMAPPPSAAAKERSASKDKEREKRRLEKRVATLEEEIAVLEGKLAELRTRLSNAHAGDWQKLHALVDEERSLDEALSRKMEEWSLATSALSDAQLS